MLVMNTADALTLIWREQRKPRQSRQRVRVRDERYTTRQGIQQMQLKGGYAQSRNVLKVQQIVSPTFCYKFLTIPDR